MPYLEVWGSLTCYSIMEQLRTDMEKPRDGFSVSHAKMLLTIFQKRILSGTSPCQREWPLLGKKKALDKENTFQCIQTLSCYS